MNLAALLYLGAIVAAVGLVVVLARTARYGRSRAARITAGVALTIFVVAVALFVALVWWFFTQFQFTF
jgi:hypothetical protein